MLSLAERFPLLQRVALYLDPIQPKRIGRRGWMLFALILLLAALPSLWAPFDGDQALFFVSGEKILKGGVLYRDIVDLKPPLIYFIYAAAVGLFGKSVLAVRLVELLVQGGVLLVVVRMGRRASGNDTFGLLSGLFYALLYFSLPFYCRGQVEGFAALPIALILSLLVARHRDKSRKGIERAPIMIGLLIGLLVLLKTSFIVMLPLVALLYLIDPDIHWKRWLGRTVLTAVGLALPIALAFLYLWVGGALGDFSLVQKFTGGYAAAQWKSLATPVMLAAQDIPKYFGTTWSVLLALLTGTGIFLSLFPSRRGENVEVTEGGDGKNRRRRFGNGTTLLLLISVAIFLLLLGTVAVEAKYLTWHFNRLFVPGAVLAAWGGMAALRRISTAPVNGFSLSIILLSLIPLFLFSPLVRYGWNNGAFITNALKGTEGFSRFIGMEDDGFDMEELSKVGGYIREHRKPGDKLFAASGWGGSIHYYAEDVPDFKIYHSCYLIAPYTPAEWRGETVDYLLSERPRFIVAQRDAMAHITGVPTTSLEMLHALPGIDSLLGTNYHVAMETKMTVVYERGTEVGSR